MPIYAHLGWGRGLESSHWTQSDRALADLVRVKVRVEGKSTVSVSVSVSDWTLGRWPTFVWWRAHAAWPRRALHALGPAAARGSSSEARPAPRGMRTHEVRMREVRRRGVGSQEVMPLPDNIEW